MELGIGMFGDLSFNKETGKFYDPQLKLHEILEEIKLADEVGLDVFGLGEHHRPDYSVSSPEIVLAAAATITKNIKLMSTVTVLSSAEPVKVYQDFSTIDLISGGRAEIGVGRGSFIESFPLFGYNLKDYNQLFEEKLDLLLKINNNEVVTWNGKLRAPMVEQSVYPRAVNNGKLPVWVAVGGTPESVARAAKLGLPLILAIIGGNPAQFKPLADYYREGYAKHGHDMNTIQIGVHAHTFVSDVTGGIDAQFDNYAAQMNRIGKERGWGPYSRAQFNGARGKHGSLFYGDVDEVTDKILQLNDTLGLTRFIGHMDVGSPDHKEMMRSIELFGTKIAPAIRKAVS